MKARLCLKLTVPFPSTIVKLFDSSCLSQLRPFFFYPDNSCFYFTPSLLARFLPRALLAAFLLARDSCSATFSLRIFEQKRDCSQSRVRYARHINNIAKLARRTRRCAVWAQLMRSLRVLLQEISGSKAVVESSLFFILQFFNKVTV